MTLLIGQIVIANEDTFVCKAGEQGVVVDEYEIEARPGWTIIFQGGGYDGFSVDEVRSMLIVTAIVDAVTAAYKFTDVLSLSEDFKRGAFDLALNHA